MDSTLPPNPFWNSVTTFDDLPIPVLGKIFGFLSDEKLSLRLVSKHCNAAVEAQRSLVFTFDGNQHIGHTVVDKFFIWSENKSRAWDHLCLKNSSLVHLASWIQDFLVGHVQTLTCHNCSLKVENVLELLPEFPALESLTYVLDADAIKQKCFSVLGKHFQNVDFQEPDQVPKLATIFTRPIGARDFRTLAKLKDITLKVRIEEEIIILKLINAYCNNIENLSVDVNHNDAGTTEPLTFPALTTEFSKCLVRNGRTLKKIHFFLAEEPGIAYETKIFKDFIQTLTNTGLALPNLTDFSLNLPPEEIPSGDCAKYIFPLIRQLMGCKSLEKLELGSLVFNKENKYSNFLDKMNQLKAQYKPTLVLNLGIHLQYSEMSGIDDDPISPGESVSGVTIESTKSASRNGRIFGQIDSPSLQQMYLINRTDQLSNYGFVSLTTKFRALSVLVVEDMSPGFATDPHTAQAKIGDNELQAIFRDLQRLSVLRISANMACATDSGFTGLRLCTCQKYRKLATTHMGPIALPTNEPREYSISNLTRLTILELKGLDSLVSDMTPYFGLCNMVLLRECSMSGKHEITKEGIQYLQERAGLSSKIKINITVNGSR